MCLFSSKDLERKFTTYVFIRRSLDRVWVNSIYERSIYVCLSLSCFDALRSGRQRCACDPYRWGSTINLVKVARFYMFLYIYHAVAQAPAAAHTIRREWENERKRACAHTNSHIRRNTPIGRNKRRKKNKYLCTNEESKRGTRQLWMLCRIMHTPYTFPFRTVDRTTLKSHKHCLHVD